MCVCVCVCVCKLQGVQTKELEFVLAVYSNGWISYRNEHVM